MLRVVVGLMLVSVSLAGVTADLSEPGGFAATGTVQATVYDVYEGDCESPGVVAIAGNVLGQTTLRIDTGCYALDSGWSYTWYEWDCWASFAPDRSIEYLRCSDWSAYLYVGPDGRMDYAHNEGFGIFYEAYGQVESAAGPTVCDEPYASTYSLRVSCAATEAGQGQAAIAEAYYGSEWIEVTSQGALGPAGEDFTCGATDRLGCAGSWSIDGVGGDSFDGTIDAGPVRDQKDACTPAATPMADESDLEAGASGRVGCEGTASTDFDCHATHELACGGTLRGAGQEQPWGESQDISDARDAACVEAEPDAWNGYAVASCEGVECDAGVQARQSAKAGCGPARCHAGGPEASTSNPVAGAAAGCGPASAFAACLVIGGECDARAYPEPGLTGQHGQTIWAGDGGHDDEFGRAVAMDGDLIVVGAPNAQPPGPVSRSGAAYVYERGPGGVLVETRLVPSDPSAFALFGADVAIDDGAILVGAPRAHGAVPYSGAAYLYTPDGAGGWSETKVTVPTGANGDEFGASVAMDGGRLLVGAPGTAAVDWRSGTAYLLESGGAGWAGTQFVPSDADWGDQFGTDVALDGDRVLIGAPFNDDGAMSAGSAYLYDFNGTGWAESKFASPTPVLWGAFGLAVALDGDRIALGERGWSGTATAAGAVHVGTHDGQQWNWEILTASDSGYRDYFGASLAVRGDQILVGAPQAGPFSGETGAAYLYNWDGAWQETKLLAADGEHRDEFGHAVALDGWALVGSPSDAHVAEEVGSAHLFAVGPDTDQDCFTDVEEETAGSDPSDARSVPTLAGPVDLPIPLTGGGAPASHGLCPGSTL